VFALIAVEQSVWRIAKKLGISRTTVETHCAHIKQKLGYRNAEELKSGARELLGERRVRGELPDHSQAVSRSE
jgi:DNA-binding CsgD family transcriptional regulator